MSSTQYEIRPGTYYNSAVLMQLQKGLTELPGVLDAGAVMATNANCTLLEDNDLLPQDGFKAGPEDLLIVIRAEDVGVANEALGSVDEILARRPSATLGEYRPHSVESAAEYLPDSKWVLVSVPGGYAKGVADQALRQRLNVFLYSDNVSREDEISLKATAQAEGLLVMGPDCGTAIINGIGFGFANRVRRGKIGIVGASGTGVQAVSVGVHALGAGISHAIGTGGRDLHPDVGGITSLQGLDLLARDPETEVIVFVSKPPDPEVAGRLLSAAQDIDKPVVVNFIGYPSPARSRGKIHFSVNLSEAAALAVALLQDSETRSAGDGSSGNAAGYLRGLFSGGTLAYESMLGLQAELTPLYSNVPLIPSQKLTGGLDTEGHIIIDLGEDEFTAGRLHPMIDNDLRLRYFRDAANDPNVSIILMDVVLGEGAHPDPAGEFVPVIQEQGARDALDIVVVLVGTDEDPQNLAAQLEQFSNAGAEVFLDLSDALEAIGNRLRTSPDPFLEVALEPLQSPVAAINVGLESFFASVKEQGAQAVHVDWKPPAGGNKDLMALLNRVR